MRSPHPPLPNTNDPAVYDYDEIAIYPTQKVNIVAEAEASQQANKFEALKRELMRLMREKASEVHGAFMTIDLDEAGHVTEAEACMVLRRFGVAVEKKVIREVLAGLGLHPHTARGTRVYYHQLLAHLQGKVDNSSHHHDPTPREKTARSTGGVGDGEREKPNAEGGLARRVRREWRAVARAFNHADMRKRGVVTEKDIQRILVSQCSPVPMKQLRWLITRFRKGSSNMIDYKALMAYFSPADFAAADATFR